MLLADGDRPAEGDFWFRILTSDSYSARGRINHGAFKGGFMRAAQAGRSWDAEASGRLRSLAGTKEDVRAHAIQYCKDNNNVTFYGYMVPQHGKIIIGSVVEGITLDVRYTPIEDGDTAHADLTFTGPIPENKSVEHKKLMMALQDYFAAIHETQWWMLQDVGAEPAAAPVPIEPHRAPSTGITEALRAALRAITFRK